MHIMAYILQDALVLLSLFTRSLAQQDDPVKEFCRRWGHATARIDSMLYIDGGMVGEVPFTSNHSSMWSL
jgi:hypothetical protein